MIRRQFLKWLGVLAALPFVGMFLPKGDYMTDDNCWALAKDFEPNTIFVGKDREIKTLNEALAIAKRGDTIVVLPNMPSSWL